MLLLLLFYNYDPLEINFPALESITDLTDPTASHIPHKDKKTYRNRGLSNRGRSPSCGQYTEVHKHKPTQDQT